MAELPFRLNLIGREREKTLVDQALADQGSLRVLYFKGLGGIGKTALLQYASEFFAQQPRPDFLYSGIIDLYDYDNHSPSGLEGVILDGLRENLEQSGMASARIKAAIANYQRRSKEYQERRFALPASGGENRMVESERQALSKSFIDTYKELESKFRVVLCFDTIELLQHEIDQSQRKLNLTNENILLKNWLCNTLLQMTNSVVLLAGRPETEVEEELQLETLLRDTLGRMRGKTPRLEVINLEGLQEADIVHYLRLSNPDFFEGDYYSPDSSYIQNVKTLTGGKPIMLGWFAELCGQNPWRQIEHNSPKEAGSLINSFEEAIIGEIQRGRGLNADEEDERKAIEFLSWARKGLRAESLAYLLSHTTSHNPEKYTLEVCQRFLNRLRQLSFIKVRESNQLFFLHDEIYRIMNLHLGPGAGEITYQLLIEYSGQQTRQIAAEAEHVKEGVEWYNNPTSLDNYLRAEVRLQKVILERLYYHLCADIRSGYDEYRRLGDLAISGNNYETDERLRDEFLRFMAEREGHRVEELTRQRVSPGILERDDALHWLKRLAARGRGESPEAQNILSQFFAEDSPFEGLKDPLFYADLVLTEWSYSVLKTRDSAALIARLKGAIESLEQNAPQQVDYNLPKFGDYQPVDYAEWRYNVLLGVAYNNLGYTYRVQRWLLQAEEAYRTALPYLGKVSRMQGQRADTVNNLAFVYRLLGNNTEARILCDEALRERERQGHSYAVALSYNTLGLIYLSLDQYDWALQQCQTARRLIERATGRLDSRGVGLVYNALGKVLRSYGRRWKNERSIEEAIAYLRNSTRIFDDLREPPRQVEAYNELGCAFRALGIVQEKLGKIGSDSFSQAFEYLSEAISLCGNEMPIEKADCYHDLAEVYYRQGNDDSALAYLDLADDQIDERYFFDRDTLHLPDFPRMEQVVPECISTLGKNELLRGDILFQVYLQTEDFAHARYEPLALQGAIERYIRGLGYLESFSPSSDLLRVALARTYYRFVEKIRQRSGVGGWLTIQRDRKFITQQVKHFRDLYHLTDSPAISQLISLIDY